VTIKRHVTLTLLGEDGQRKNPKTYFRKLNAKWWFLLVSKEHVESMIGSDSDSIPVFRYHLLPSNYTILCIKHPFPEGAKGVVLPWKDGQTLKSGRIFPLRLLNR
jgi:hypothetical protein